LGRSARPHLALGEIDNTSRMPGGRRAEQGPAARQLDVVAMRGDGENGDHVCSVAVMARPSAALWMRFTGCRARQRLTSVSSASGTSARTAFGDGGGSLSFRDSTPCAVAARYGASPTSAS